MKIHVVLAALALSSTAASAADLAPLQVEPVAPTVYSWEGFYAGVHAGAAFGNTKITSASGFGRSLDSTGFIGGVHAGYNLQLANNVVVGLEGDLDYTSLSKSKVVSPFTLRVKSDWQGSLRGRLGYGFDRFMPYVTAGIAFANERYRLDGPGSRFNDNGTRIGWTVGAGLEYAVDDHWLVRGEVRYSDFGKRKIGGGNTIAGKQRFNEVSTLVGISYKF